MDKTFEHALSLGELPVPVLALLLAMGALALAAYVIHVVTKGRAK